MTHIETKLIPARITKLVLAAFLALAFTMLTACGGGDDDSGGGFGTGGFGTTPSGDSNGREPGDGGSSSGGDSGPAPDVAPADPGTARLDVDGDTIVYGGNRMLFYTCELSDGVHVNIQTGEGHDLLLQYVEGLGGSITTRDVEADVYYAATIRKDGGIWIEDNTVIFSGDMERQQASDRLNSEAVEGTLVVNCDPPGGENPKAEIDGNSYEFPASGAQSYTCLASDTVEIDIGRNLEGRSLEINMRVEGGITLGSVSVRLADSTYFSQIPDDGEGFEVNGNRVTYAGTFEQQSGRTVTAEGLEGTVTVTCP